MNTEEHLEHIEHSQHAAHSPFDRRVAMTMAIVAAVLACVTMLSHRAHNETLKLQGDANRLQTEANIFHTRASDQWGFFQAKNIRDHEYKSNLRLLKLMSRAPGSESDLQETESYWKGQVEKYTTELPKMQEEARELVEQAKERQTESLEKLKESASEHHKGDRFDQSELGVEFALVLCSIAVLTKQRAFWYSGIVAGSTGVIIAATAFFVH